MQAGHVHTRIERTDTHKQAVCDSCPWTGEARKHTHIDVDFAARWEADLHDQEHRQ